MFKFITEKKHRPSGDPTDFALLTPLKTTTKVLFNENKENLPAENSNHRGLLTPFTKRIKMNIEKAFDVSNGIIARIGELEQQLEQTRLKIEEEQLDLDQVFDTPSKIDRKESILKFELSDLKLESAQKIHRQSHYFSSIQKLKVYAKRYYNFEHFTNYQLKAFQKVLLGDRLLFNGNYLSGKMTIYMMYIKMIIEESIDKKETILIVASHKRIQKIEQNLKIINASDFVTLVKCSEVDQSVTESIKTMSPSIVIIDSVAIHLDNLLRLRKMTETFDAGTKFMIFGFYSIGDLSLAADILRIQKSAVIAGHGLNMIKEKDKSPKISISYDEDMAKSVMKFIRDCIDSEKSKKLKIRNENHVDFVILTKDKVIKDFVFEFSSRHAFKVAMSTRCSNDASIIIVPSLKDIKFSYKHLFVIDFEYELNQFCDLTSNFGRNIHICLNLRLYEAKRREWLRKMSSPSLLMRILSHIQENEQKCVLYIDCVDRPIEGEATEQLCRFLQSKGLIEINDFTAAKKLTLMVKNQVLFNEKIAEIDAETFAIFESVAPKIETSINLDNNVFEKIEEVFHQLKKDGVVSFQVTNLKKMILSTKYRKIQTLKIQFESIINEYNEKVCNEIRKVDSFYTLLKGRGFAHITRTKNTEKTNFHCLQGDLERIFLSATKLADDENSLPFKSNYKKHDLVRDLCTIIKDNLSHVNEHYFGKIILNEQMTFEALVIDIAQQIFLDGKNGFEIDNAILQKIKSINVVRMIDQLKNSYDIIKKELLN
jgi:hypothetical protein